MNKTQRLPIVLFLVAGALAFSLSGCVGSVSIGSDSTDPTDSSSGSGDTTDVFTLEVGDCIPDQEAADDSVTEVPTVPCSEPHTFEVYSSISLPDGDYPGEDAIKEAAAAACLDAYADFIGIAYDDSVLDYSYFFPTEGSWNGADDRSVSCVAFDPSGETVGTLAGAGV